MELLLSDFASGPITLSSTLVVIWFLMLQVVDAPAGQTYSCMTQTEQALSNLRYTAMVGSKTSSAGNILTSGLTEGTTEPTFGSTDGTALLPKGGKLNTLTRLLNPSLSRRPALGGVLTLHRLLGRPPLLSQTGEFSCGQPTPNIRSGDLAKLGRQFSILAQTNFPRP